MSYRPALAALAAAAALAPLAGRAQQTLRLGAGREPGGAVTGRVCADLDGDGCCAPAEPGVSGARLLAASGAVAVADGLGRYHLLELPSRLVAGDRTAYGSEVISVEGLGARSVFELAPGGAATVDLAVPVPAAVPAPAIELRSGPAGAPRRSGEGLFWPLGGRAPPGTRLRADGREVEAAADGLFALEVPLAPGQNELELVVLAGGGEAVVLRWPLFLARRARGGDLVLPGAPARLGSVRVLPASGGGALVVGALGAGARARVGGLEVTPGRGGLYAAFVPPDGPSAELELLPADGGAPGAPVRVQLPLAPAAGLRAASGLAEVELSFLGDPGLLVAARGAGAARGRFGPVDVVAGMDLDDRDRDLGDLARPRDGLSVEHALDPDRTFLTAGDGAAAGELSPGRGRIFARVEAPGARLDLGLSRTGLTGTELGRYDRALHGAKGLVAHEAGPLRLEAGLFGASLRRDRAGSSPPAAAHDVLGAVGGAFFWLAHGEVVPGSEALRVEWRDPFTGRIAGQRALVRGEDYELDWAAGRVVLARPLPSVAPPAALVTGAPTEASRAVLVADYLHAAAAGEREELLGGRAGAALGPLRLGARGVRSERDGGEYRLAAASAELTFGELLGVRAELARSEGQPFGTDGLARSADGGYRFGLVPGGTGEADALHVEAGGAFGRTGLLAWWREREAGYADGEQAEPSDARERGAELKLAAGPVEASLLHAERKGTSPVEPGGAPHELRRTVARGVLRAERLVLTGEAVRADLVRPAPGEETSAGLRASYALDPAVTVDLSHHQKLAVSGAGQDPTFTAVGATLAHGATRLSVRGGHGPDLGTRLLVAGERQAPGEAVYGTFGVDPDAPGLPRGSATALGARRSAGRAEIFTEEQFARDAEGLRSGRVVGASFEPVRGLRATVSGERGERLRATGGPVQRNAAAGGLSLVRGALRLAARGEVRTEGDDDHAAAGGSAEWRPGGPLSLSARVGFARGDLEGREALALEASAGAGLRLDRGALLLTVARLADQRPGEARRDGVVGRLAASADLSSRLALGAGAALALWKAAGGRDERIAGSIRATLRLAGPLDAAAEYARRAPLGGGDLGALDAVRAEAGLTSGALRVALGYTFVGFGGDGVTPEEESGRLFLRARIAH